MRLSDTILGILLIIFAAVIAAYSQTFPAIPGQEYGAAVFPALIAIGLAGCGLALIARRAHVGMPPITWSTWARNPHSVRDLCLIVLVVVFYATTADMLGFVPAMAIVIAIVCRILKVKWLTALTLALVLAIIMRWVFGAFLYVPLPKGMLIPTWL